MFIKPQHACIPYSRSPQKVHTVLSITSVVLGLQDVWDSKQITSAEWIFDGPGIFNVDGEAAVLGVQQEPQDPALVMLVSLKL